MNLSQITHYEKKNEKISREILSQKLKKAMALADDAKNNKFFEIH